MIGRKLFDSLTKEQKAACFAEGSVIPYQLMQIENDGPNVTPKSAKFKVSWCARIHGIIVSIDDNWQCATRDEARAYGLKCKAHYRTIAKEAGLL
jgi:hypothetical protein